MKCGPVAIALVALGVTWTAAAHAGEGARGSIAARHPAPTTGNVAAESELRIVRLPTTQANPGASKGADQRASVAQRSSEAPDRAGRQGLQRPATDPRHALQRRFAGVQISAAQPAQPPAVAPPTGATVGEPQRLASPIPPESIGPGQEDELLHMSLDDVTQILYQNNPAIREANLQADAARGRAWQASMYPNPVFGSQGPQLAGNQSQYNAFVAQDLVTKGKIRLDTAAAERAARQAELHAIRVRFDALTTVRQRFYTALVAQRRVEMLQAMVSIAQAAYDVSQRLLKAEVGTRGDVLLLQIELSRAEVELRNAVTLAETTRRQLAAATGVLDLPITRLRGSLKEPLPDYELIAVQQGVLARNATARSAEVEIGRNQFVLRRAQVEPFPNINFMGGYQYQAPEAGAPVNQGIYQVQMIVPLWNRNQGNIRAAAANVSAAVAQYGRVNNELANEAAAAFGRYRTAHQLAERYERTILPSAEELQDISSQLYKQGQIDFIRYLNAQRALLDANLAYLLAQESRWSAAAEVAGLLQSERFP